MVPLPNTQRGFLCPIPVSASRPQPSAPKPRPRRNVVAGALRVAEQIDRDLAADRDGVLYEALLPATDMLGGLTRDGAKRDLTAALDGIEDSVLGDVEPARGWGRPGDPDAPQPSQYILAQVAYEQQQLARGFLRRVLIGAFAAEAARRAALVAREAA